MKPPILIVNRSTKLSDDEGRKITAALQIQVSRDFSPFWGVYADLYYIGTKDPIPATVNSAPMGMVAPWQLVCLDNSDVAGALGYHDLTPQGMPLGKAFVGTDLQFGYLPSVTMSHELLEMLADPDISQTIFYQTANTKGILYALEVCDAVEADGLAYDIDGVKVSDFVTRAWFQPFPHPPTAIYSFKKHVSAPFALAPGGYIGIFKVTNGSGWQQLTASATGQAQAFAGPYRQLPPVGSRRERRQRRFAGGTFQHSDYRR